MEELKLEKRKNKGMLKKTWERCKSFGNLQITKKMGPTPTCSRSSSSSPSPMVKSKSWSSLCPPSPTPPSTPGKKPQHGCFSVYVGPDKQRFVIKVECTKHPLFKMLLEEAELEYGFHSDGPLMLPCDVDSFVKVLIEMDGDDDVSQRGCRLPSPRNPSSYNLLSPPTLLAFNQF